jgi:hypothetical protein
VLSKYDCVVETDETVRDAMVTIASQKRQTIKSSCARSDSDLWGTEFMPLYFFDFTDGEHIGRDQFGTKLPDVETAAREAVAALANISKDVRKHYQDRALAVNIRSQTGETVLNVSLTLAVTSFPDEQIECDQLRVAEPIAPAMLPAQANSLTSLAPD